MIVNKLKRKILGTVGFVQENKSAIQDWASKPDKWVNLLSSQPDWISRHALSFASGFLEPSLFAQGLSVEEWAPEKVGLRLDGALWKKGRSPSFGSVISLGELAFRIFWEEVVAPSDLKISISQANWESGAPNLPRVIRARYGIQSKNRDELAFQLQSQGEVKIQAEVLFLDSQEKLVGSLSIFAHLKQQRALPK